MTPRFWGTPAQPAFPGSCQRCHSQGPIPSLFASGPLSPFGHSSAGPGNNFCEPGPVLHAPRRRIKSTKSFLAFKGPPPETEGSNLVEQMLQGSQAQDLCQQSLTMPAWLERQARPRNADSRSVRRNRGHSAGGTLGVSLAQKPLPSPRPASMSPRPNEGRSPSGGSTAATAKGNRVEVFP